jgi:hypothetical protein
MLMPYEIGGDLLENCLFYFRMWFSVNLIELIRILLLLSIVMGIARPSHQICSLMFSFVRGVVMIDRMSISALSSLSGLSRRKYLKGRRELCFVFLIRNRWLSISPWKCLLNKENDEVWLWKNFHASYFFSNYQSVSCLCFLCCSRYGSLWYCFCSPVSGYGSICLTRSIWFN